MKKALLSIFAVLVIVMMAIMIFGIQTENVQIEKQKVTLKTTQSLDIQKSNFGVNYLQSDKVICVNLWATWCVPCIKEMPMLNDIKKNYAGKNVEFLSLSLDTDSIKLKEFINKGKFDFKDITLQNLAYRNVIINFLELLPPDYKVSQHSVPVTYLVKNNKVVNEIRGIISEGELESILNQALK